MNSSDEVAAGTRPAAAPAPEIPASIEELDGTVDLDVVVLVATGIHRGSTEDELRQRFGDEVFDSVRVR